MASAWERGRPRPPWPASRRPHLPLIPSGRSNCAFRLLFMKSTAIFGALLCLSALPSAAPAQTGDASLLSRAEASHYEETSRYDDVVRFFNELQKRSPLMRQEIF